METLLGRWYSTVSGLFLTITDDSFMDGYVRVRFPHEDAVSYPIADVEATIALGAWVRHAPTA